MGKFKIGLNLAESPMDILQIRAFLKPWYEQTNASLYLAKSERARRKCIISALLRFFRS